VFENDDLRTMIVKRVGPLHWSELNKLHYSEARKVQRDQRTRDTAAYLSGIEDVEEKEFVRQRLESMANRAGAIPPIHPLPPLDDPSNPCPLLERVLAQAYLEDPPEDNDDSYSGDLLLLRRDLYDEPDGGFTAPDELMRTLKGVMLNGLCRGICQFEIELNKDAVPHFVQGMKVGMPDLKILQLIFHPDISEHQFETVLKSLISSHGALPYLIQSGAVPTLHRHMTFPTRIGILRLQ
jgi:hypothetical protein